MQLHARNRIDEKKGEGIENGEFCGSRQLLEEKSWKKKGKGTKSYPMIEKLQSSLLS